MIKQVVEGCNGPSAFGCGLGFAMLAFIGAPIVTTIITTFSLRKFVTNNSILALFTAFSSVIILSRSDLLWVSFWRALLSMIALPIYLVVYQYVLKAHWSLAILLFIFSGYIFLSFLPYFYGI